MSDFEGQEAAIRLAERRFLELEAGCCLREAGSDDRACLQAIYASTRLKEMELFGWPPEATENFLKQQFEAQELHYQKQYDQGRNCLIEAVDSAKVLGRLYWVWQGDELLLIDISLLPEHRGQGKGERFIRALQALACSKNKSMGLHVMLGNPAQRLYVRLGFIGEASDGMFQRMRWASPLKR